MEKIREHCDLTDGVSEVLFIEELKDFPEDDLLLFIPENSDQGICMSKEELMTYWYEKEGFVWGNCHDEYGRTVSDEDVDLMGEANADRYCNRYYKIPKTGQYISDVFAGMVSASPLQVYRIADTGVTRPMGRNTHVEGEFNSPAEKVYSLCLPEDEDCQYQESLLEVDIDTPDDYDERVINLERHFPNLHIVEDDQQARDVDAVREQIKGMLYMYQYGGDDTDFLIDELAAYLPNEIDFDEFAQEIVSSVESEYHEQLTEEELDQVRREILNILEPLRTYL